MLLGSLICPPHDFYPRSPCGERPHIHAPSRRPYHYFYPRSPCGERHKDSLTDDVSTGDFYPRSPCGERQPSSTRKLTNMMISIHALLAESDICVCWMVPSRLLFLSTLSLRRATTTIITICTVLRFLSTLSLRRATTIQHTQIDEHDDFYPRSPCGERHLRVLDGSKSSIISIHALLAESDHYDNYNLHCTEISIHALLAESDAVYVAVQSPASQFLSTLSLRRATLSYDGR